MPSPGETSTTKRPHVVIVSSDQGLSDFLGQGLLYGGFWTSVIASAIQTLEVFRLRSFDLVLVDTHLAGMGAIELVKRLRGRSGRSSPHQPRADIPILLVAEPEDAIDPQTATAAGAAGILLAPIDLAETAVRLHEAIASWQPNDPS